ncbi:transcriptional regulator [Cytobacillus sp. FSL R7-0696]|uniref:LexA family protein n=1 Tax=Cytobacillus sp. FSL R7-0696 TaxID=2921691 RepID=UPI0030F6DA4A
MRKLTTRQREVLDTLEKYVDEKNYPPSYRELSELTGIPSSSTISRILHSLRDYEYVSWNEGQPRTLRITKTAS